MDERSKKDLAGYEALIGWRFRDPGLLREALTHSSYCQENGLPPEESYERLEFLGDAVLDAFISRELYDRRAHVGEGQLTKLRALIVCEKALDLVAAHLRIGEFLFLGRGEERTGGRTKASILADAVESTLAAILLDGGQEEARRFVDREFTGLIDAALAGKLFTDYKTRLQEILQQGGACPEIRYITEAESGPDHDKTFQVRLEVNGRACGTGTGRSKKEAQQDAARKALAGGNISHGI